MSEALKSLLKETANSYLYMGEESDLGRPVVYKVLKADYPSPQRIIQFNNEYEFTKNLSLPGVRKAFRSEKRDGKYTLVLEYIDGETIREAFVNHRRPLDHFLGTAVAMTESLRTVHEQGIIHKDLNPNNILVTPHTGRVTIIDFGISSRIDVKTRHLGNPNQLEGSLAYISPEQTGRMNRIVDYRTDFYSLGVTFYEMLTGRLPFEAKDSLELVHCHIARVPPKVHQIEASVPEVLSNIVAKLMSKNAEDRYQSAYGLKEDLQRCQLQFQHSGSIHEFELGESDFSGKLNIPEKLYGREKETADLMAAFERAANGALEMVLVDGYAGVGKSALVNEVHKPITEKRGYFISGKYDQYQRNIPYYAIIQAFNDYCNLLLTESLEVLEPLKEKILQAVGNNGQVLLDLVPGLALIIGEQPLVEKLEAQEATNRFNLVFQKFLRVISNADHPLVVFIDDLQWADTASLNLLKVLLTDEQNRHLLIVGAFRDNETGPTHPLMQMLDELKKEEADFSFIHLKSLSKEHVHQMVQEVTGWSKYQTEELAGMIYSKTLGNAFFTVEFLKSLGEKKLLSFDFESQKWVANLADIRNLASTDNVVTLMAGKIGSLPKQTVEALKLASCIGNLFDLKVLSVIFEKNVRETLEALWKAMEEGLVVPSDNNYKLLAVMDDEQSRSLHLGIRFLHDRVQQAAYSLIEEEQKQAVHLRIGRLLLENKGGADDEIFDVVNQLNIGKALITGKEEKLKLARLNLRAGKKAKDSSAFGSALSYLKTALELLNENSWAEHFDLTFDLYKTAAEVEYLNGNLEESERLINACSENARTPFEKSDIYYLLMLRQSLSSLYPEAIETARKGLLLLDFDLPEENLEQHIGENMGWLGAWFEEHGIPSIYDRAEMSDPEKLAIIKILDNLSMPTYVSGQVNLWILHVLLKVRLSIESGNTPETGYAFSELGLIFCILGNYALAFPCADLSRRLGDKFERQSLRHKSRSLHLIANYINPWRMHYRDTESTNNESYRATLDSGELIFTGYTIFHPFYNQFYMGSPTLPDLLERIPGTLNFAKKIKHDLAYNSIRAMRMFILNLTDQTSGPSTFEMDGLKEHVFVEQCTADRDFYSICIFYVFKAKILYLYEEYEPAFQSLEQAKSMLAALSGHAASLATYNYCQSLILLALYPKADPEKQKEYLAIVTANQARLKTWSELCPDNFKHKYLLVEAELARLNNEDLKAVALYNDAAKAAQKSGYVQEEALANELAGKFLLEKGAAGYAHPHLLDARHNYLRWGAVRKSRMLEEQYPTHFDRKGDDTSIPAWSTTMSKTSGRLTTSSISKELDFRSVVKASQALSGEIVLEKLLAKMIQIMLENAGAQKAVLILKHKKQWKIEAIGNIESEAKLLQNTPLEESDQVPMSILNTLIRSTETLVIDDVTKEARFSRDPYILLHKPKSILAMPLVRLGKTTGFLYLENTLATAAFTPSLVETLGLLSAQMAVSIKNAQLYDNLRELNQAYARFVPREFLRTLGRESILDARLGDQKAQEMTVMFTDIRSYASLAESMKPEQNFNFINAFFQRMGPCISENNGFINQYLGDGIMALFPDPESAVKAAISMQKSLNAYNETRLTKGRIPIKIGTGIHTGSLMLGIIGDENRHDVGVISDVVNSASRLEGLTKIFGVSIIASEDSLAGISRSYRYNFRFLGKVQVKGREGVMHVFEFFDGDGEETIGLKKESAQLYLQGLDDYFDRQFAEAAVTIKKILTINPDDKVAEYYLKQAARYLFDGAPPDWTGVEKMEEK